MPAPPLLANARSTSLRRGRPRGCQVLLRTWRRSACVADSSALHIRYLGLALATHRSRPKPPGGTDPSGDNFSRAGVPWSPAFPCQGLAARRLRLTFKSALAGLSPWGLGWGKGCYHLKPQAETALWRPTRSSCPPSAPR